MAAEENQTKQHHHVENPSRPLNTSCVNTWETEKFSTQSNLAFVMILEVRRMLTHVFD